MLIIVVIKASLIQKYVGRTGQEFNQVYSYTVTEIKERCMYRIHDMIGILYKTSYDPLLFETSKVTNGTVTLYTTSTYL
jgi:hypothetical protein